MFDFELAYNVTVVLKILHAASAYGQLHNSIIFYGIVIQFPIIII